MKVKFQISNQKFEWNIVKYLIGLAITIFISGTFTSSVSSTDGTIDNIYKYAWGENTGWLNFGTTGGNVHVTDSALTGYIWSENYGWINLNPTTSGVTNDGEGNLGGYAWGENLGWINFDNVNINSEGVFTGTATGVISGTINFDCSNCTVKTDWRPTPTLTFSLGANSVSLGTLSTGAVSTSSHTLTVGTNATSGVVVSYVGATLTSGANTIDAMATATTSLVGTEQFGINAKDNTTPDVGAECSGTAPIAAAATGYNTVDNFKFVSGETIVSSSGPINDTTCTISYIANIAAPTEASSYTTTLTYIATGTF